MLLEDIGDQVRRRPGRQQHGGGARRHRKGQRIAEPVGEEQLGHRIADVAVLDAEDGPGIKLIGELEIGMGVHGSLGLAGRAGGVEPKAHVVARGRRGHGFGFGGGEQIVEALVTVRRLAGHDDVGEISGDISRGDGALEFWQQLRGDDQQPGAGILQHEAVIVFAHQRVDRHRDHAGLDGAEKSGRPIDSVEEADQNALLAADAERAQHMAEALDPAGEVGIAVAAARIDEGGLAAAAGVEIALEDIGGEIVIARDRGRRRAWRNATHRKFLPATGGPWPTPAQPIPLAGHYGYDRARLQTCPEPAS